MAGPRIKWRHLFGLYFRSRKQWPQPKTNDRREVLRRFGVLFGNTGYLIGLFEYIMTDMLSLRCFALGGCSLIVAFQAVQPKIQWISAGWNSVYALVNVYHIRLLLLEKSRDLTADEAKLLKALGSSSSPEQVLALVEAGEWRRFPPGATLQEEGKVREPLQICLVAFGRCDIKLHGFNFGHLGPGVAVGGELSALRLLQEEAGSEANSTPSATTQPTTAVQQPAPSAPAPTPAKVTVVAGKDEEVLCLCIPYADLPQLALAEREKQREDPSSQSSVLDALQRGLANSLAMQVAAVDYGAKLLEYAAVLEVACSAEAAAAAAEEATARERFAIEAARADLAKRRRASVVQKLPAEERKEYSLPGYVEQAADARTTETALRAELEKYRARRHVSVKEHFLVAETLPKCIGSSFLDIKSFAGFEDTQYAIPEE
eukprot:TRINITY_DN34527_c0_g1_i1.p1 TRINITY_DN34527_c0_g1~~TRINITY_DN34527_c0_g1_i1.p1  ORF type:complete len:431 (-),score=100.07 TRINITY_DN34527_c0_g1_i1:56-1348(-)